MWHLPDLEGSRKENIFKSNVGTGFPPVVRWKPLVLDDDTVKEPSNPIFKMTQDLFR